MALNRLFLYLVALIATACAGSGKITESAKENADWISFSWASGEVSGKHFDKLAINVPIQLEGIPHAFDAQFDLGATGAVILYEQNLRNYFRLYPAVLSKLDTSVTVFLNNTKNPVMQGVNFKLDEVIFQNHQVTLYKNYGKEIPMDSVATETTKHIGTVGAGLAKDKYLIIDYPNQRLALLDSLPEPIAAKVSFVEARVGADNRIKVPLTISGETHHVMFDTGASLFPLSVGTDSWYKYVDASKKDSMEINSWGQKVYMYSAPSKVDVYLGRAKLPRTQIYSLLNNSDFDNFYKEEGVLGLTGNAYFLSNVVVIDFKNKRFGVVQE